MSRPRSDFTLPYLQICVLITAFLVPASNAQSTGTFVYDVEFLAPSGFIVSVNLIDLSKSIKGIQASPTTIPGVSQTVIAGPLITNNNFGFAGQSPFLAFSFTGAAILPGSTGALIQVIYEPASAAFGQQICPLANLVLSDDFGVDIVTEFAFDPCLTLPETIPQINVTLSVPQLLSSSETEVARYELDVNVGIEVPFAGFQINYQFGDDKAIPDAGDRNQVLLDNNFVLNVGTVAAVAFPSVLSEISAEDNPAFSLISLDFFDPLTVVDQEFCIDETQTAFSDIGAKKIGLSFPNGLCTTFPSVTIKLEASGPDIRVLINNAKAIAGLGLQISGPFPLESSSNGALAASSGFETSGISPVILNSPTSSTIAPQLEFGELAVLTTSEVGEYCILPTSIFISDEGLPMLFVFLNGQGCITIENFDCPTVGTGDVNLDGILNIFDLVFLTSVITEGIELEDECEALSGDLTEDGIINILDITTAIQIITQVP